MSVYGEEDFEKNRYDVKQEKVFQSLVVTIAEMRDFINDLSSLAFGRDIAFIAMQQFVNANLILDSAMRTLESIRYCCLNSNFADAYTLLRKYRDDLFYYLYLLAVSESRFSNNLENLNHEITINEKYILEWIDNKQKDLHITVVLKYLASMPILKNAILKFELQKSFDKLSKNLNNYVHSNGLIFYNKSCKRIKFFYNLDEECKNFSDALIFISITFLFLLALMRPISIMSKDYSDCLECNVVPPKDSQYWVAPFISEFFNKYSFALDSECINYLRKETGMQI